MSQGLVQPGREERGRRSAVPGRSLAALLLALEACRQPVPTPRGPAAAARDADAPAPAGAPDARALAPLGTADATAQAPAAPRPLPATADLRMHLPGADARRYLTATVDIAQGAVWRLSGCVSTVAGSCRATHDVELSQAQREAYVRLWSEVYATPPCEPVPTLPGDRVAELSYASGRSRDPLPGDPSLLEARTRGPCLAAARLSVWIARTFGALP